MKLRTQSPNNLLLEKILHITVRVKEVKTCPVQLKIYTLVYYSDTVHIDKADTGNCFLYNSCPNTTDDGSTCIDTARPSFDQD